MSGFSDLILPFFSKNSGISPNNNFRAQGIVLLLEVHGQGMSFVLDDFRRLEVYQGSRRSVQRSTQDKGHAAEARAFIRAVATGGPLPVPFAACVESTAATLAARDALACGLPLIPDRPRWRPIPPAEACDRA